MYEILVKGDFSSAHNLRGYKGRCEELHGHNWKVEARFEKADLNDIGISVDFTELKSMLKDILKKLDHTYLNKMSIFKKENPSAENIARFIYVKLKGSIRNEAGEGLKPSPVKEKGLSLKSISVWESETSCAMYYE
ncbi:MAG: 6-carboxytetrahydropterin synthase QueD [Candidatus Omnitrophica bacterium CG02_land_8_20_14_3_00__42_8]|nr:MAG: 6-carboxytetrahydropterin synthase QueD [Candidatus Omnitrophica bacterium CG02_land_8_20_14_3_00__42_8]PIW67408.1 MAG: 6-carboxytetrahydropterin synthase QueD [Candidatus Omnitrophica bacterium CG12_big_fil_rev_8_21_14_0_65_42_8]